MPPSDSLATVDRLKQVIHWQLWIDSNRWKWKENATFRYTDNCGQTQTGGSGKKMPLSDTLTIVDRLKYVEVERKCHL